MAEEIQPSTPAETTDTSVRADLSAAIDGATGAASTPSGDAGTAGASSTAQHGAQPGTAPAGAAEPLEAPQHWPAKDRELFAKAAPEQQQWLLARHKAMEADYTRRVQETAGLKRRGEQFDELLAPYKQRLAMHGVDEVGFVRYLTTMNDFFEKDFAGAVRMLAQQRNIDLSTLIQQEAQVDPTVRRLEQQLQALQTKLSTGEQSQQQAQINSLVSQIDQFAEAKDASGQPLRPYFNDVAKDILRMVNGMKAEGEQVSAQQLQQLYESAVYANPEVRTKLLAAQQAEQQKKAEDERKRKAEEARRAGFDVRGTGGVATAPSGNSVRADLEAAFAAHSG